MANLSKHFIFLENSVILCFLPFAIFFFFLIFLHFIFTMFFPSFVYCSQNIRVFYFIFYIIFSCFCVLFENVLNNVFVFFFDIPVVKILSRVQNIFPFFSRVVPSHIFEDLLSIFCLLQEHCSSSNTHTHIHYFFLF